NFFVSGADDSLMKGWDLRTCGGGGVKGGGGGWGASPAFVQRGTHVAGVTTGAWHPTAEHCFVSGSYDEFIRLWDARILRKPAAEHRAAGGVWRLAWHPSPARGGLLLAACMHGGVEIVSFGSNGDGGNGASDDSSGGSDSEPAVVARFTDHASMAYGADWCHLAGSSLVASCSFYDRRLGLWQ
ncbi:unnamed protein product, partial [Phaeothamnion confervicola]